MNKFVKHLFYYFLSGFLFLLIALMVYAPVRRNLFKIVHSTASKLNLTSPPKEHWMNVFVHGSVGSIFGLLSVNDVMKDKIKGTNYRKFSKYFRKQTISYKDQPILQKGLFKLQPSFDLKTTDGKKFAAYPILKAYHEVAQLIDPENYEYHFYTFGWSGLLSQSRRRMEAIRFYNALQEEIEVFKKSGITPKIRILTHSHGGNLSLNLASVNKLLELQNSWENIEKFSDDSEENDSLKEMYKIMKELSSKQEAQKRKGQKIWSYLPEHKNLHIDEFILLGSPIQPETEKFFYSSTFGKVYNFYSEQDSIQAMDFFSTKSDFSNRRLILKSNNNKVVQAKVTTNTNFTKNMTLSVNEREDSKDKSFFHKFLEKSNLFKKSDDPTHKELWFASWKQDNPTKKLLFGPLPVVVFVPLFVKAMKEIEFNDFDLSLTYTMGKYVTSVVKHNENKIYKQDIFPAYLISKIKNKLSTWQPDVQTFLKEFDTVCSYSD